MSTTPNLRHTSSCAQAAPDIEVNARATFDNDIDMVVPAFSRLDYVPVLDPNYQFDTDTTLPSGWLCAQLPGDDPGLSRNCKSTHIEQVAARLNWPCIRVTVTAILAALTNRKRCDRIA